MPARRAATILHADLDAFYASVEQRDDPLLLGRPVAVGPGIVLAASYEARRFGVRAAMPAWKARALCPHLRVVPARFDAYVEASRAVLAVLRDTSPVVEPLSIDEAFVDVRGLEHIAGSPEHIARTLRERVRREVGLPLSAGVATTKHLAKVASAAAKPDGLLVVRPEDELAFLHALPVERLWGVGPATAERLRAVGLRTAGQVAATAEADLVRVVGRASGRHLLALAHNRDPRPVRTSRRRRSVGAQHALGRRARTAEDRDAVALGLVDRVTRRLRAKGLAGRTVVLRLRFGDFTHATRSRTSPRATASSSQVLATLRALLQAESARIEARGLTLLGVTVTNLEPAAAQLELALGGPGPALDAAVDAVHERFGRDALQRAALLDAAPARAPEL